MPTKAELQVRVDELKKENASLKKMLSRAERELSGKLLPEELPPADILDRVSQWMKSFGLPWEAFGATTIADGVMNLIAIFPTLRKGTPALNAGDSI
ncbi:hypothetical protein NO388_23170 [Escherichia coli]|nr:hypothetical protein [Escherichia coli]